MTDGAGIAATLGEVLTQAHPGRTSSTDVTVFDSTGVVFQDLLVARQALDGARETGRGQVVKL